jgi:hypothetical protein
MSIITDLLLMILPIGKPLFDTFWILLLFIVQHVLLAVIFRLDVFLKQLNGSYVMMMILSFLQGIFIENTHDVICGGTLVRTFVFLAPKGCPFCETNMHNKIHGHMYLYKM